LGRRGGYGGIIIGETGSPVGDTFELATSRASLMKLRDRH